MQKLLPAVLLLALVPVASAESIEEAAATFEKSLFNEDPVNKIALKNQALMTFMQPAERLEDPRAVDVMYRVIDRAETWYDVGITFEFFTKCRGAARERLAADLVDRKSKLSPEVRAAIAFMIADYGRFYGEISEAERDAALASLADRQPEVRAHAARALQAVPEIATVDALLAAWKKEKHEGVITHILQTLRQLTDKPELARDLAEWESWRAGNPEAELKKGFTAPKPVKGTYGDLELEFTPGESGSGSAIWVLPPYGVTCAIYTPELSVLESLGRVTLISLPAIGADIEVQKNKDGVELYPVDALVAALEALREERKENEVVLVGFADASFILTRYAQLHPDRVAALIIVSGWLDQESYVASLEELKIKGTDEEKLYAMSASEATAGMNISESQRYSISIGRLSSVLLRPQDVHGCYLWETFFDLRDPRKLQVPRVELDKKDKIEVPVLFVHGKDDRMSSFGYTSYQGKLFFKPKPKFAEIEGSGPMVWHDRPAEFLSEVEKFLKKVK